jgi:hypothetical protein
VDPQPSAPQPTGGEGCLAGTSADYRAPGPYRVQTKEVTAGELGRYTIFYPDALEAGCRHPIVAWGNGTGVKGSGLYARWHRHAASWGLVVIASHDATASSQRFLEGGIAYLLQESGREPSAFYQKLSPRAGVAGHSQGGEAANIATQHPNVQAEVCVSGYGDAPRAGVAFLCETGSMDFANVPCSTLYATASGPAFLADHQDADHMQTPTAAGAGTPAGVEFVRLYTAWFRCFLADDDAACGLFRGGERAPLCGQASYATCEGRAIP